jgi:hypothetical protein
MTRPQTTLDQELPSRVRSALRHYHPSGFLLAAQLLLLILYAVFDGLHSQRALISASGVVVLMLVVWVVNRSPAVNWIAWALAIPALILTILSALSADATLIAWASLLEAILYFYAAGSLIAYMMGDYRVTMDELFAAGATFTLLAWAFAYIYLVIQTWSPGSFLSGIKPGQALTFVELLFLSFTNLTATGLSDISPVTTAARVPVMLEQFVGVGYVAVVVSRLIGLTIQGQKASRP